MKVFLTKADLTDPKLMNNSVYEYSWYRKASWILLFYRILSQICTCLFINSVLFTEGNHESVGGVWNQGLAVYEICHSVAIAKLFIN